MSYRDDRGALRSEVDELQKELGAARADQARFAALEQRLDAAKREMQALEAELGRARKRPRSGKPILVLIPVALAVVSVVAGAVMFLTVSRPSPALIAPAPPAVPTPPPPPELSPSPPSTAVAVPEPPLRTVHVTWSARVTKSTDAVVHPGMVCQIDANAVPDSSGMHVRDVAVACGGHAVYDERAPLNGMSMLDSAATQRPGPTAGSWVYELAFSDAGNRAATRNQAKLDSTLGIGKVWSENMPDFRIDLAILKGSRPVDVALVEP